MSYLRNIPNLKNPGDLDKKGTIQKFYSAQNTFGEAIKTYVNLCTAWIKIIPLQGLELYQAQQLHAEATYAIKMRYRAGIVSTLRLKYKARYFDILYVQNVGENNTELNLLCKEVV
jgi:SPP1 family predicted phage head-tail adaptor